MSIYKFCQFGPHCFANSGPIVWNRIDGMLVSGNTVTHTNSLRTTEACCSFCLIRATCVALEYRPGSSPHCSLDNKGRFEAGSDWQEKVQYNYFDFYYDTRGQWTAHTLYVMRCNTHTHTHQRDDSV